MLTRSGQVKQIFCFISKIPHEIKYIFIIFFFSLFVLLSVTSFLKGLNYILGFVAAEKNILQIEKYYFEVLSTLKL